MCRNKFPLWRTCSYRLNSLQPCPEKSTLKYPYYLPRRPASAGLGPLPETTESEEDTQQAGHDREPATLPHPWPPVCPAVGEAALMLESCHSAFIAEPRASAAGCLPCPPPSVFVAIIKVNPPKGCKANPPLDPREALDLQKKETGALHPTHGKPVNLH